LNVEGREPCGVLPASEYDTTRQLIADRLEAMVDHLGAAMGNSALAPEDIYPEVIGIPPDLIVYLGGLNWRSSGAIGNPSAPPSQRGGRLF
jgi:predicted AlkP superfamily phosphohydrolase/phosphomutase